MYDATTPKASEITASCTFYGPDYGAFPVSAPSGSTGFTVAYESLLFDGGDDFKDFSAAQQIMALERKIKQSSSIKGQLHLTAPPQFIAKFQQYGPLCMMQITVDDPGDTGNELVLQFKGNMKIPSISFLDNPGTIDFEIRPYGVAPSFTIES